MNEHTVFRKEKKITIRKVGGVTLIIPFLASCEHNYKAVSLSNESSQRIWGLIDGKRSVSTITKTICSEYKISDSDAHKDVTFFIDKLTSNQLIERVN